MLKKNVRDMGPELQDAVAKILNKPFIFNPPGNTKIEFFPLYNREKYGT